MVRALFFIALFAVLAFIPHRYNPEITTDELKMYIEYLASDRLEGRRPGTRGDSLAAYYIKDHFADAELKPLATNGLQYFDVTVGVSTTGTNLLEIATKAYTLGTDFMTVSFSADANLKADIVFVGYGFDINTDSLKWNDYAGLNVRGKLVMVLRGDPEMDKSQSAFIPYSSDRSKVLTAADKGAAGVILVSGVVFDKDDALLQLSVARSEGRASIPVIHIKRTVADAWLAEKNNPNIETLEKTLNDTRKANTLNLGVMAHVITKLSYRYVRTHNVVAMIEGSDPALKNEYVVLGAHYDHLGYGGHESGSRRPDTTAIHNGADDNASGTATLIELAQKLSKNKKKLKRSVILVAFAAEEAGLLGSKYFVKNAPVDLKNIKAMINFDMVGRMKQDNNNLTISGTGTGFESDTLVKTIAAKHNLKISTSPEGFGPSDHASFYTKDIPVLFFTTGSHDEYHTPGDDYQLINYEGQKLLTEYAYDVALDLINRSQSLTFQEAGPKERQSYSRGFKVKFGIMPAYGGDENNGLGVDGVTPNAPAHKAGMLKGDIIVAIEGKPVLNIYDYMNRLTQLKPGQLVSVDIMRNGEKKVLLVQL